MNTKFNVIRPVVLFGLILLGIVACGGGEATSVPATIPPSETPTESPTIAATPKIPVASVVVEPRSFELKEGANRQLIAVIKDDQGNRLNSQDRDLLWAISDRRVATISENGLVLAVQRGQATITVIVEGHSSNALAQVTVESVPIARVEVSPKSQEIVVNETISFTAIATNVEGKQVVGPPIEWSSEKSEVAEVNSQGNVTGKSPGITTITAKVGDQTAEASVIVKLVPVSKVTILPPSVKLGVGQKLQLIAVTEDGDGNVLSGRTLIWTVDSTAASVTTTGEISGIAPGRLNIFATSEGRSGQASVEIISLAPQITPIPTPGSSPVPTPGPTSVPNPTPSPEPQPPTPTVVIPTPTLEPPPTPTQVVPTPTLTPTPSPTPVPFSVNISQPTNGESVPTSITVAGTTNSAVPSGVHLWLVVQHASLWWPQSGEIFPVPSGESAHSWQVPVFIGQSGDEGKTFGLIAILVPPAVNQTFDNWFIVGQQTNQYPGFSASNLIGTGAELQTGLSVTRN